MWSQQVVPFRVKVEQVVLTEAKYLQRLSWIWHETVFDSEAPILELWEMWSTAFSLPLILRSLTGVVVPVRVPPRSQIELFNHLTE